MQLVRTSVPLSEKGPKGWDEELYGLPCDISIKGACSRVESCHGGQPEYLYPERGWGALAEKERLGYSSVVGLTEQET